MSTVADGLAAVHARIARACATAQRAPGSVRLVAVTKGVATDRMADAVALGELDLGENRVQELTAKMEDLPAVLSARGIPPERAPRWHMIGTLQRNKVRAVTGRVALIHSVDSVALAREIGAHATKLGVSQEILIEVNASGEPSKHGFAPDAALAAAREIVPGCVFRGFMTIAPEGDAGAARACFATVRGLREQVHGIDPATLELSMGMSGDLEIAIEEGATLVRIGTAIFGPRTR